MLCVWVPTLEYISTAAQAEDLLTCGTHARGGRGLFKLADAAR